MCLFRVHVLPILFQFLGEIPLLISKRFVFLRIFFEFLFFRRCQRLFFFKNSAVRAGIVRHAVFDPALRGLADAIGDGDADRDLHDGDRDQCRKRRADDRPAKRTDEGKDRGLVHFDIIHLCDLRDHVDFISDQSDGPKDRSRHDHAGASCRPADEALGFFIPVINDTDLYISFRRVDMGFFLCSGDSRYFSGFLLCRQLRFLHDRSILCTDNRCLFHFFTHKSLLLRPSRIFRFNLQGTGCLYYNVFLWEWVVGRFRVSPWAGRPLIVDESFARMRN